MSENKCLWLPSEGLIQNSNLLRYLQFLKNSSLKNYADLYQWSIEKTDEFWLSLWNFFEIISSENPNAVGNNLNSFSEVNWFPDIKLNYAENLLKKHDNSPAIIFRAENRFSEELTWKELYRQISLLQQYFQSCGVKMGERVALMMPNRPETVVCVLAAASLGASVSLCSPDFGVDGVVDRFGQIEPMLFIYSDYSIYNGKEISISDKALEILAKLPTVRHSLCVPYFKNRDKVTSEKSDIWTDIFLKFNEKNIEFTKVPFSHPLYILFSSGTTGIPKCIVHGVGGTLLQHLKEHQLHCNLKPGDRVFYFTTCGWMMWQWLIGCLASQCTLLLYDGSPFSPDHEILFQFLEDEKANFFGTSAKYIDSLRKLNFNALEKYPLKFLNTIASTGSPLLAENFDYVYEKIKKDVCLSSISGGTDIISCFVLGNPIGSVYRGEIQTRGLGMAVDVFNEHGQSVMEEKGELVCTKPFPSMPVGFWGDKTGEKYKAAYFQKYVNIWHHGDWMELKKNGGAIIYGRSDTTLNPGGVRIGTAEIYRQVEAFEEIRESVVVDQHWKNETRIVLFVVMQDGFKFSDDLVQKVKHRLKTHCSPRHVPAKIVEVPQVPRTKSGKIMEIAVKCVIHHEEVKNKDSMSNPESLAFFQDCKPLEMD